MPLVVDIKFKETGKKYWFDPKNLVLNENDIVIVETAKGIEAGYVAASPREIADSDINFPLKSVLRKANDNDLRVIEKNKSARPEALRVAAEKIAKHKLDMKLVDVEFSFDSSKVVFYFTAEGRVDFRELVRDLASHFRGRIELRQIGIRDECKMLGGIAPCGRVCCCNSHLKDFEHVTIKMAKTQGFPINPAKISGLCGRLMCCLKYENDFYAKTIKRMPKNGSTVNTPDGPGTVVANNIFKEKVKVRVAKKDDFELKEYDLAVIIGKETMADEVESDKDDKDAVLLED